MLAEDVRAAAASGQSQELAKLISRPESNKFAPDSDGRTALHLAAAAGHTDCTVSLILAGAPVNALDSSGCTALQIAASEGYELILDQLLKHGANPNNQDNVHGNTALHEATWKGFSRSVAVLCKGKANMHIKNFGGFAALHLCCQNGHNQSCRELLIAGCSPDLQNNYGDTPLHTSARYGHAGVTRILISAHSRVSDQNKNGDTALHIAAAMGRRKMTRILIEAGCDKTLRNKQQETAKDIATRKDLNEIIMILNNTKRSSHKKKEGQDQTDDYKSQHKDKRKNKSENKVHFEKPPSKNWSPYGCHYYPDSKNFPAPNLDSLPNEPLHRGEQYFLDLAGNIRKGPVGVGYMCYCAPFFQHMEARLERDKEELKKHINSAEKRIDKKVQNLERQTEVRISQLRKQHQHLTRWLRGESYLPRTRSLDLLDDKSILNEDKVDFGEERRRGQGDHKSMDDLCSDHESYHGRNHDHVDKVGHFWRTQFSSERLRRSRGSGFNKTKCPDLVSSVTQKLENCNTSPHDEEHLAMRETVVKDLTKSYAGNVESGLPNWRRSVHEVSRLPVQWRSDEAVDRYSDSSDGEDCERPGPWAEVKRLPYRSRSAVYSPTLDNNDSSGYSTKICSNSQGPSPSLSGRLQGDDLHVTKFYIDQSGLPVNKTHQHHAVPLHPDSCPSDLHYTPASVPVQPNLDTHSSSPQGTSPLDPPYLNPSSLDRTSHYPIPSGLTLDRFTANECQNLHSEASLV